MESVLDIIHLLKVDKYIQNLLNMVFYSYLIYLQILWQVYPFHIPDLSSESPLTVSGRYRGNFPDTIKAKGVLADLSNYMIDLKVEKAKDIPIDRVRNQLVSLLTFTYLCCIFWSSMVIPDVLTYTYTYMRLCG